MMKIGRLQRRQSSYFRAPGSARKQSTMREHGEPTGSLFYTAMGEESKRSCKYLLFGGYFCICLVKTPLLDTEC